MNAWQRAIARFLTTTFDEDKILSMNCKSMEDQEEVFHQVQEVLDICTLNDKLEVGKGYLPPNFYVVVRRKGTERWRLAN